MHYHIQRPSVWKATVPFRQQLSGLISIHYRKPNIIHLPASAPEPPMHKFLSEVVGVAPKLHFWIPWMKSEAESTSRS